jgi:hypothetical protein
MQNDFFAIPFKHYSTPLTFLVNVPNLKKKTIYWVSRNDFVNKWHLHRSIFF